MAAGKIAEACDAFQKSHSLDPAVTTIFALATCRERLGQLANAMELFLEAERQTRTASDKVTAQLHTLARDRAAKLEPRVPKLTIMVPDQSKIAELEILRDTVSIPAEGWNRALPVNGGTYTITARVPGANEWSTTVTLATEADIKTVDIPDLRTVTSSLEVPPKEPAVSEPVTGSMAPAPGAFDPGQDSKPPETPAVVPSPRRLAPIAVGAGAVVLLGGALGFSMWGDSTYNDAKAEMTDLARRHSLYDSANLKRYAAQGFAAAGVGCAGVAVWLYLRQRGTRAEPTSHATRWMLAPTSSGIGVAGQF
jgi:hypothetical protein